ncbi:hypothetical protein B0J13DRAFT_510400 [Dactylonectria estremocensis]|uniref:Zn(2)-C6 fungal-type domain-containing protein n=1 Tax=Dactylonectria estremocensis TaxID=1079267 RepID=A0A9P9IP90_9HYPO|nr:hypothetical protein B0J13DRAFT_510400 [Dactylonectria estremocensis]
MASASDSGPRQAAGMQNQDTDVEIAASSRRRASKACLACRARKVRCDVVLRDGTCTNCALDKRQCVVKARPSKYRTHRNQNIVNHDESEKQPTSSSHEKSQKQPHTQFITEVFDCSPVDQATASSERSSDQCRTSPPTCFQDPRYPLTDSSNHALFDSIHSGITNHANDTFIPPNTGNHQPGPPFYNASAGEFPGQAHVIYSYFPFLDAELSSLSHHDVQFLESQGCFKVPGRQAADEFVRQYFLHVHPGLPLLDECAFWDMYYPNGVQGSRTTLSLFVFQAMLFASCSSMSVETLRSLGFASMLDARGTYYRRAKLLFDFCGEQDPVSNAQGALLLSYNAAMRGQKRANSIWLATAIQLAQAAGAHQFDCDPSETLEGNNSLKRLWWCCIVRDRILPLGVRRQLHIPLADFEDKSVLTEADFAQEITGSRVYDAETKASLIGLFITLCDLAVSLTDVIITVYTSSQPIDIRSWSIPKLQKTVDRIESCKSSLNSWFERATLRFPTPAGITSTHESLVLYTNVMYMYYHSARLALYQYEALLMSTGAIGIDYQNNALRQSRAYLEDSAAGITENLKELVQLRLAKYIPISIVAFAALPIVLHIIDVKLSTKPSQTAQKQGRLNVYMEAMKGFETQYDGVHDVWSFIRRAVEYATLDDTEQEPSQVNLGSDPASKDSACVRGTPSAPPGPITFSSDWGNMFLKKPALYFRLVQTIDHSLSMGRYSDHSYYFRLPKSVTYPISRVLISDSRDGGRHPPDTDDIGYSGRYETAQSGIIGLIGAKPLVDQSASLPSEIEDPTGMDFGLTDLQIPILFEDIEFELGRDTSMFAGFSA